MKMKKVVSLLCAAVFLTSSLPVSAGSLSDQVEIPAEIEAVPTEEEVIGEDRVLGDMTALEYLVSPQMDDSENEPLNEVPDIVLPEINKVSDAKLQDPEIDSDSLVSATSIGDLSKAMTFSANSITQSFTDFLLEEGEAKFVELSLAEGGILNASLVCPNNANLDYDLALASIAEDGTLHLISVCNLGTYIDPDTGKTVDEGISYIHNQASAGNYAVLVMATKGSSSIDSFTLTISLDSAGSYDRYEPNDSPFTAANLSSLRADGSLHVGNDQDWYVVPAANGVYKVTAGNYQAEVYYVEDGNRMVRAIKSGGNYILGNGIYYVRVFSDAAQEEFNSGTYTLQMADQSKYATIQTAFDFGNWENSYSKLPDVIPMGQQQAYYKFHIDTEDQVYASVLLSQNESGTIIEFLDSTGKTVDFGFSGNPSIDLPIRGLIKKSNSSFSNLVVNIDGSQTNSVAYLRVTKADPLDILSGGSPSVRTRIHSGYHTFRFSGTAKNTGNSISTNLSLNLTNSSYIPPHAIVDRISTKSSMSYNVGGVYHQLNPGGMGWQPSSITSATSGDFDFAGYRIEAKQPWQFRYSQTAFMSTTMSSVEMSIYWDYDVQYTNYELFK